ncbi:MAG: hypothetical protein GXP48_01335 [Acidobacteria bacterium]|nr:hypothetical protein [Acidobacteriota bacterium]
MRHALVGGILVLSLIGMPACARKATAPASASKAITARSLGLELAGLPDGLKLASRNAGIIILAPRKEQVGGTIVIDELPKSAGLNLLDAVHGHQAAITARTGGKYLGAQELKGPLGTAFWSRGQYMSGRGRVEETVIFTLSPDGTRIARLRYTYPAGNDSSARVKTLLDVLGEIEAIRPVKNPA